MLNMWVCGMHVCSLFNAHRAITSVAHAEPISQNAKSQCDMPIEGGPMGIIQYGIVGGTPRPPVQIKRCNMVVHYTNAEMDEGCRGKRIVNMIPQLVQAIEETLCS